MSQTACFGINKEVFLLKQEHETTVTLGHFAEMEDPGPSNAGEPAAVPEELTEIISQTVQLAPSNMSFFGPYLV